MSILMFKFSFHWNQEEEQRLRKVAVNISKDVKKFWVKIEKLVNLSRMVWSSTNFYVSFFSMKLSKTVSPGALQASDGAWWEEEKGTW